MTSSPVYYREKTFITDPIGNNQFSRTTRKTAGKSGSIAVPPLIQGSIFDVRIGEDIVFEEQDEKNSIVSCVGLAALIDISTAPRPTAIVDNHNHAFYMRHYRAAQGKIEERYTLVHIDQHADLEQPLVLPSATTLSALEHIAVYTNEVLHVGSFIIPAIHTNMLSGHIQIRSQTKLADIYDLLIASGGGKLLQGNPFILDIDIDFWSSHEPTHDELTAIRALYTHATCCTIAVSPYFIPIEKSIAIAKKLYTYIT